MSTYHFIAFIGDKTCTTHIPRVQGSDYYIPSLAWVWNAGSLEECNEDNCLKYAFDLSIGTIGQLSLYNDRDFAYVSIYDFNGNNDSFYDSESTSIKEIGEGSTFMNAIEKTINDIFAWADERQEQGANDSVVFDAVVFQMSWKDCEELATNENWLDQTAYNNYIQAFVEKLRELTKNDKLVFINRATSLPCKYISTELGNTDWKYFGADKYRDLQLTGISGLSNYIIDSTLTLSSCYLENSRYVLHNETSTTEEVSGRDQVTFSHNDLYEEGMSIASTLSSALGISTYIDYLDVTLYNSVDNIDGIVLWSNTQGLSEEQIASMSKQDILSDTENARELSHPTGNLFVSDLNNFSFYYVLFYSGEIYAGMYKFDTVQVTSDELKVCISLYKRYSNEAQAVSLEFAYYKEHVEDVSIVFNQFLDVTTNKDTYATISDKLRTANNTDVVMQQLATSKGPRLTTNYDDSGDSLYFDPGSGYIRDRDGTSYNPFIRFWFTPYYFIKEILQEENPADLFHQVGLGTDKIRGLYIWTVGVKDGTIKITITSSGAYQIAEYYEVDYSSGFDDVKDDIDKIASNWDRIDKRTANIFRVYTCGKKVFLCYKNSMVVGLYNTKQDTNGIARTIELPLEESDTFAGDLHPEVTCTYYKYRAVGSAYRIYKDMRIIIPAWWDLWYLLYLVRDDGSISVVPCSGNVDNSLAIDAMTELTCSRLQNTDLYPGPKYDVNNVTTLYYVGGKIIEQLIRQYGYENIDDAIANIYTLDNGIVYCQSHGTGEEDTPYPYRFFPLSYRGSKYFEYAYMPASQYYGISNQGHYTVSKSNEGSPVVWYSRFIDEVRYYQTESSDTTNPSESVYSFDDTGITYDDYTILYYRGFMTIVFTGNERTTLNENECIAVDLFKNNSNN